MSIINIDYIEKEVVNLIYTGIIVKY